MQYDDKGRVIIPPEPQALPLYSNAGAHIIRVFITLFVIGFVVSYFTTCSSGRIGRYDSEAYDQAGNADVANELIVVRRMLQSITGLIFCAGAIAALSWTIRSETTDLHTAINRTNALLEQQNHINTSIALYLRDLRDRQQPPTVAPAPPENLPK
jgi:hypothetical protein